MLPVLCAAGGYGKIFPTARHIALCSRNLRRPFILPAAFSPLCAKGGPFSKNALKSLEAERKPYHLCRKEQHGFDHAVLLCQLFVSCDNAAAVILKALRRGKLDFYPFFFE